MNDIAHQVGSLETENRHLILKGEADERTIQLLKQQNDELHSELTAARAEWDRRERELKTERDIAVLANTEIEGILTTAAGMIINGLRKRVGDATPAEIPDAPVRVSKGDPRLPAPDISMSQSEEEGLKAVAASIERAGALLDRTIPSFLPGRG